MNKKISSLSGVAIIVVIAAVAGLVIAYQNWQTDPVVLEIPVSEQSMMVADWKTEADEQINVQIEYLSIIEDEASLNILTNAIADENGSEERIYKLIKKVSQISGQPAN